MGTKGPCAEPFTLAIRVVPGSARTAVGGTRGDALVVRVTARAVDGRATEAALAALADALGVRRREVRLRSGATSRDKLVLVEGPRSRLVARMARLRDPADPQTAAVVARATADDPEETDGAPRC